MEGSSHGPSGEGRNSRIVVATALCVTLIAVFPAFFLSGESLTLNGLARIENRIEADLGTAVRSRPGRFAYQDTMAWQFVGPATEFAASEIGHGRLPLWAPGIGAGWPLLASGSAGVFSPFKLPLCIDRSWLGQSLWVVLKVLFAGISAYLLARRLGARPAAAAVAGTGFMACGYMVCYAPFEHDPISVFPAALLATDAVVQRVSPLRIALCAVALAAACVSGHPVLAAMVLLGCGIWVVARAWPRGDNQSAGARGLAGAGLALMLAFALSAPLILPFREFLANGWSYKMDGTRQVPEETVERTPALGARRMASTLVPHLTEAWRGAEMPGGANLFRTAMGPDGSAPEAASFLYAYVTWIGVVPLLLAGIFLRRRERLSHPVVIFTALGAVVLFGMPGTSVLQHVPGLSAVLPRWFASWFSLGVLAMAAMGAEDLAGAPERAAALVLRAAAAYVGLAVVATFAVVAFQPGLGQEWGPALDLPRVAGRLAIPAGLAAAAAAGTWLLARRAAHPGAIGYLLLGMTILDLAVHGGWIPGSPRLEEVPAGAMERVVPGAGPTTRIVALGNAMAPDTGLHYGASDLQAVLPLFVERYRRFMQLAEPDIDQLYPTSAGVRQAGPWTDLASVERVVVPVAWRLGLGDPAVEFKGRGVRTSRRPDALPRAYVAHAVRIEPDMDGAARAMAEGPDDRRLVPVVEPGDTAGPWESLAGVSASAAPLTPARIERYDPTEVVIDVHGSGPGLLVLTDTFYPGWEAEIDGEEAPIVPANLAFRGVPIGAGAGEVVFRYRPSSLRAGLLIAGTGAVVLLGLLGLHFRDRLSRGSTA